MSRSANRDATDRPLRDSAARGVLPRYHGREHVAGRLPDVAEPWPTAVSAAQGYDAAPELIADYVAPRAWVWPRKTLYFLCDVHADADALFTSLVASGGLRKTGSGDDDWELTEAGAAAEIVIGGDLFDKGPSTLRLLRVLRALRERGAHVDVLAGNHDLRTAVGLAYMGRREPRFAHLFVRMGKKTIPLFKEIWDSELAGRPNLASALSDVALRELLMPPPEWYETFPELARGLVPEPKIGKELIRIREKAAEFEAQAAAIGLRLSQVYAAAEHARRMFLEPRGEYFWLFDQMQLARKEGSYLFVHAGLDDTTAAVLRAEGVDGLNREFHTLLERDLFELYHGPVGNVFRTKYRDIDHPMTAAGVRDVHAAGVHAIVHGHKNILRGQRMVMRAGLLNFECDASIDVNTRALEGLSGAGGAVVVFREDGRVVGLSTDHPAAKVFDPARLGALSTVVAPLPRMQPPARPPLGGATIE
jgi:hypothetical protein